jgi:hypothetical protein
MAKKANTAVKNVEVAPQVVKEKVVTKAPVKSAKPEWEIKDRTYLLKGAHQPITYTIQSKHSQRWPMLWFNNETG